MAAVEGAPAGGGAPEPIPGNAAAPPTYGGSEPGVPASGRLEAAEERIREAERRAEEAERRAETAERRAEEAELRARGKSDSAAETSGGTPERAMVPGGSRPAGAETQPRAPALPGLGPAWARPPAWAWVPGGLMDIPEGVPEDVYKFFMLRDKAMNVLGEGITIADMTRPEQPLVYANAGFCRMTGYSLEEAVGRNCRFLQGAETKPEQLEELRRAIREGRSCKVEIMNYKKTGEPFMNHLSLNPIYGGSGQLTHFVGIQMDVTELCARKVAEAQARAEAGVAEAATKAKSQFLARMSHEIRTPLNGMIAVGQLLAETKLSPAQDDLVSTIRSSGESLLTLISDILDFSRIEAKKISLRLQNFDLQGVIESAFELSGFQAAKKRLQMAYTIAESCPAEILGDPNRLRQVLLNLLMNAVKFTDVGEVVLEVWAEELTTTATGSQATSSEDLLQAEREQLESDALKGRKAFRVHFSVKDTGIGISRDGLRLLFRSFSQVDDSPTRKYGGSGLGLAISQRLCEAMGGTMWAESEGPGCGSKFQCTVHAYCGGATMKRKPSVLSLSNLHKCSSNSMLEEAWAVPPPQEGHVGALQVAVGEDRQAAASPGAEGAVGGSLRASKRRRTDSSPEGTQPSGGQVKIPSLHGEVPEAPTDLRGKSVLLVEGHAKVRQVLAVALRRRGLSVHAAATPEDALVFLGAASVKSTGPSLDFLVCDSSHKLILEAVSQAPESLRRNLRLVMFTWPSQDQANHTGVDPRTGIRSGTGEWRLPSGAVARGDSAACDDATPLCPHLYLQRPIRQRRLIIAMQEGLPELTNSNGMGGEAAPGMSAPGKLTAAAPDAQAGKARAEVAPPRELRVLIAEDNAINMKVALKVLKRLGQNNVVTCQDGQFALEELCKRKGPSAFDLVLTDLHMPRMGGMDLFMAMKERWSEPEHARVPVVAITADAFEETQRRCLSAGFAQCLTKPFRVEELSKLLRGLAGDAPALTGPPGT